MGQKLGQELFCLYSLVRFWLMIFGYELAQSWQYDSEHNWLAPDLESQFRFYGYLLIGEMLSWELLQTVSIDFF